jgi:hypothetical protein
MKCRYVGGKYMHFMTSNSGELGHREQGDTWDWVTISGCQKRKWAAERRAQPNNRIPPISKLHSNFQIETGSLPLSEKYSNFS